MWLNALSIWITKEKVIIISSTCSIASGKIWSNKVSFIPVTPIEIVAAFGVPHVAVVIIVMMIACEMQLSRGSEAELQSIKESATRNKKILSRKIPVRQPEVKLLEECSVKVFVKVENGILKFLT